MTTSSPTRTRVPFNRPTLAGPELDYIREAVDLLQLSADGSFTQRCSELLESALGSRCALLTTSCTDALEMAALLLDIGPGDEVIVPAYTFVSTINAFVLRGATPAFVDIDPDTLGIDVERVQDALTDRTKAIVPVHYGGVPCRIEQLVSIAEQAGVEVVEDNAHGLFGKLHGRHLGTFGSLAALSFHETKNLSCGEGGALLVNDDRFIERAQILRDKGTNRALFRRGEVDKYTWVDVGSSFGLSDVLAAMLYAQLEARARILETRQAIWSRYDGMLRPHLEHSAVKLPVIPAGAEPAHHMYYLVLPNGELRDGLIAHLAAEEIHALFHYTPLHTSAMARQLGCNSICPVTDHVSSSLVRLPFFNAITETEQARVADAVTDYCRQAGL